VRDWVTVSRAQVYYSLRKLAERTLIAPVVSTDSGGPERQVYAVTADGQRELEVALGRDEWAQSRPVQPFLIWLAMSNHATPEAKERVIDARAAFIETTLERERQTLATFADHDGPMVAEGMMMVELTIAQLEAERVWLTHVRRKLLQPSPQR